MNHYNWKGGRGYVLGYIRVRCDGHPRALKRGGYVYEHILVMEKHLGRHVNRNEVVHHINGVKDDNRIENLKLMTKSEHQIHHNRGTKRYKSRDRFGMFVGSRINTPLPRDKNGRFMKRIYK